LGGRCDCDEAACGGLGTRQRGRSLAAAAGCFPWALASGDESTAARRRIRLHAPPSLDPRSSAATRSPGAATAGSASLGAAAAASRGRALPRQRGGRRGSAASPPPASPGFCFHFFFFFSFFI